MASSNIDSFKGYGNTQVYDNTFSLHRGYANMLSVFKNTIRPTMFDPYATGAQIPIRTATPSTVDFRPTTAGSDYELQSYGAYVNETAVSNYGLATVASKLQMATLQVTPENNRLSKADEANRACAKLPVVHTIRLFNDNATKMKIGTPVTTLTKAKIEGMIRDARKKLSYGGYPSEAGEGGLVMYVDIDTYTKIMSVVDTQATRQVVIRGNILSGDLSEIDMSMKAVTNSFKRTHSFLQDLFNCYIVPVNPIVSMRKDKLTDVCAPEIEDRMGITADGKTYAYFTYMNEQNLVGYKIELSPHVVKIKEDLGNNDIVRINHSTSIRTTFDERAMLSTELTFS